MEIYPKIQQLAFRGLGTEIDLQIVVENAKQAELAQADLSGIKEEYSRIEKIFSRFDKKSELSRLNAQVGIFQKVSTEMIEVARKALVQHRLTGGIFDPRIIGGLELVGYDKDFDSVTRFSDSPAEKIQVDNATDLVEDIMIRAGEVCFKKRLDFSGIVKGWATDRMSEILSSKGWKHFLVDSGGDMYFSGLTADGKKWRIDIEGIVKERLMLELSDLGVATSGIGKRKWERGGKRFHHIINPKDPDRFSFDLQSVTVVDDKTEIADVWAKTLFILGKEGAKRKAKELDLACVVLEYGGQAWVSSRMKQHIFIQ